MQGPSPCSVEDLLPAAGPRGDDDPLLRPAHRREEPSLPHLHGDLVMPLLVAEEPGHPAASRVDHLDLGGEPEEPLRRTSPDERLLVAVSVQEDRGALSESMGLPQQTTSGRCILAPAAARSLTAPSPTSGRWYSFQVSLKRATSAGPAPFGSSGKRLVKVFFVTRGKERRGSMPVNAAAWRARRVPATAL